MPWSPKKYWKNGSFSNGEFWRRTTWSEEILATPFTAWPAILVKSGAPIATGDGAAPGAGRGAAVCAAGGGSGSARESAAVRIRPVTTRPATNPANTRTDVRKTFLII